MSTVLRKHAGGPATQHSHKLSITHRTSDTECALHVDFIVSTLALIIIGGRGVYLSIKSQEYEIERQGSLMFDSDNRTRFISKVYYLIYYLFDDKFLLLITSSLSRNLRRNRSILIRLWFF